MRWDAHEKQGLCFLKASLLTEPIWELLSTNLYSVGQDLSLNSYHLVQNKCWLLNPPVMPPTAGPQLGPLSSCTKVAKLESDCSAVATGVRNPDLQLQPPHLSYNLLGQSTSTQHLFPIWDSSHCSSSSDLSHQDSELLWGKVKQNAVCSEVLSPKMTTNDN